MTKPDGGYEDWISSGSGTRIVHSYSPRKEFFRRLIIGAVLVAVIAIAAVGGLFAVKSLRAEPAPKVPHPKRVVQVNVQPER